MSFRDPCGEEPHEQQERPERPNLQPGHPAHQTINAPMFVDTAPAGAATDAAITADAGSPRHNGALLEVGFWADPRDAGDDRPDPKLLVDEEWGGTATALAVVLYVRSGFLESFELGYSFCRFGCCGDGIAASTGGKQAKRGWCLTSCRGASPESRGAAYNKFMGCTTLTDGKYVWPEGLAHYIKEHAVRPPEDFVKFSVRNLRALREAQAGGRLRWDVDEKGRGRPVRLSPGTAVFLRDETNLGIALPPEPDVGERSSSGSCEDDEACSCIVWGKG